MKRARCSLAGGACQAPEDRTKVKAAVEQILNLPKIAMRILLEATHRNPELLFPNRQGGLTAAALARTPLDRCGVQRALRQVALDCGIKKKSAHTACATAMPLT